VASEVRCIQLVVPQIHHHPWATIPISESRSVRVRVGGSGESYLELVLAGLSLRRGVEEVDRENLDGDG
jgi:hypothetical protein